MKRKVILHHLEIVSFGQQVIKSIKFPYQESYSFGRKIIQIIHSTARKIMKFPLKECYSLYNSLFNTIGEKVKQSH